MREIDIKKRKISEEMGKGDRILAVVTATKPDFYKQAPVVHAAKKKGFPCFIINTGQHYDDLLGHGLEEYGVSGEIGADLNIRGDLSQKSADMFLRVKKFAKFLGNEYSEKSVIPLVHGDTLAAGIFPAAWMLATNQRCAHNEAGLRGMAPSYKNYKDIERFISDQFNESWNMDRNEPFPEQFDTFIGSAACEYHFAPVNLNRRHLKGEGYPEEVNGEEKIVTVGNSVVDAIEMKKKEDVDKSVFDVYPTLEDREDWIRVDIHRRANILPERFNSIVKGVVKLVKEGYNVNFVEMNATKKALESCNLREKIERLDRDYDNFLLTGLWKKHAHVYEFLESGRCFAEYTDSGSMQEELNHIKDTISLTARFNTDRPETIFDANSNLLVPPISGDYVYEFLKKVYRDPELRRRMKNADKIYGKNVGGKIVNFIDSRDKKIPYTWSHERAGLVGSNSVGKLEDNF